MSKTNPKTFLHNTTFSVQLPYIARSLPLSIISRLLKNGSFKINFPFSAKTETVLLIVKKRIEEKSECAQP